VDLILEVLSKLQLVILVEQVLRLLKDIRNVLQDISVLLELQIKFVLVLQINQTAESAVVMEKPHPKKKLTSVQLEVLLEQLLIQVITLQVLAIQIMKRKQEINRKNANHQTTVLVVDHL
jgi:hypothetical protein